MQGHEAQPSCQPRANKNKRDTIRGRPAPPRPLHMPGIAPWERKRCSLGGVTTGLHSQTRLRRTAAGWRPGPRAGTRAGSPELSSGRHQRGAERTLQCGRRLVSPRTHLGGPLATRSYHRPQNNGTLVRPPHQKVEETHVGQFSCGRYTTFRRHTRHGMRPAPKPDPIRLVTVR